MRKELSASLQQALMVPDLPEVTQTILNLAEFTEHCERDTLPLDGKLLGERAMECRAYAKALHYKEEEFKQEKTHQVYESLILINNKLQQKEAAEGLLEYVMANRGSSDDMKVNKTLFKFIIFNLMRRGYFNFILLNYFCNNFYATDKFLNWYLEIILWKSLCLILKIQRR